jgi:hypothetical protein
MSENIIHIDNNTLIFKCPHCSLYVEVKIKYLNCKIFRHAFYKSNMNQINPHTPEDECNKLLQHDLVYGCAKPFMILLDDLNNYIVVKCGYI